MKFITKDWYGKPCPKVGFDLSIKDSTPTQWVFSVNVQAAKSKQSIAQPNEYKEGLWEQDVAEWFIANPANGRYVEFNLAANGAWWLMAFSKPRQRIENFSANFLTNIAEKEKIKTSSSQQEQSWSAELCIPKKLLVEILDEGDWTYNVCFIVSDVSNKSQKRYMSLNSLSSLDPDFHLPGEFTTQLTTKSLLPKKAKLLSWFVYMVRCADNSLYTGITTDVSRRVEEHNGVGDMGAKYTRVRRPVNVVYQEEVASRSEASKREFAIKKLKKYQKEALILR